MLRVRGYASIFGNVDEYGEVVDKGAFSDWLAKNPDTQLPLFWNHAHVWDPTAKPIGVTTKLKQTARGLYFEGVVEDTPEGLEMQTLINGGAVSAASFAFSVKDRYQKKDIWHLSVLEPKEITAANWGANPRAYIEAIPGQETSDEDSPTEQ
jgi:HK97 family phage prohead protease